jgi:hypothetical protein
MSTVRLSCTRQIRSRQGPRTNLAIGRRTGRPNHSTKELAISCWCVHPACRVTSRSMRTTCVSSERSNDGVVRPANERSAAPKCTRSVACNHFRLAANRWPHATKCLVRCALVCSCSCNYELRSANMPADTWTLVWRVDCRTLNRCSSSCSF